MVFGREFGKYYCRDSVIHESGTKSTFSLFVNKQVKLVVRFMAHTKWKLGLGEEWVGSINKAYSYRHF